MGKTGEAATGESRTGEDMADVVAPQPTTLTLDSPAPTAEYGLQIPTTTLGFGAPRSEGATFDAAFPMTFGEVLGPTLTYGLQMPETTLTTDSPEPGVTGTGTATLPVPTTTLTLTTVTPGVGYRSWQVDGTITTRTTDETATDRSLTLRLRVEDTALLNTLRALKTDEGKVDVLGKDGGGFVAVDRADGGNSFTLTPPVQREPLRYEDTYHVARYEEEMVSQSTGNWDVTLEFVPAADRTDTPSLSQSPAADEWGLTTRYGTIATPRVDAEVVGTGEGGVQRFELEARLTFAQAHVFEAAYARLGAGRIRQVPDAPNVAVDDTSGNVATVTVDAPDSQSVVSDGDYLVTEFESTRQSDAIQIVTFTMAAK